MLDVARCLPDCIIYSLQQSRDENLVIPHFKYEESEAEERWRNLPKA